MQDESIRALRAELNRRYGARIIPYGTSDGEEHGTGFRLEGAPFVFSVLSEEDGSQTGVYDVQVESVPPAEYLLNAQLTLDELMDLIKEIESGNAPREGGDWLPR